MAVTVKVKLNGSGAQPGRWDEALLASKATVALGTTTATAQLITLAYGPCISDVNVS
jgi:hypothetical protein